MTTKTADRPHACTGGDCPPQDALQALLHGDLPDDRAEVMSEHVGDCEGCRGRLDVLATGEVPLLAEAVRHIDRHDPPKQAALWKVMRAESDADSRTRAVPVVGRNGASADTPDAARGETRPAPAVGGAAVKLDFLRPCDTPGRIGRLGTFEVVRVIGRGGMGVVLHAFDPSLERDVAIKILDPELARNETAQHRFCREARAAAAVTHENIVTVHQVNVDDDSGLPYLVMQLVSGESLEQRLRRVGRLSVAEAVSFGAQAAAGLAAAHASGLIHRDVKPGNILLEVGTDKLKLTDFGLARAAEDIKLTQTGFVSGTPLYMAPEQARGDDVDHRADLFALGVVLYEALAGRPPFEGKTPLAVLRRVADDPHPPLGELNTTVPGWLEDEIDRLLAKDPAKRVQSAAEVAETLGAHVIPATGQVCDEASVEPCAFAPALSLSRVAKRQLRTKLAVLAVAPLLLGLAGGALAATLFGWGRPQVVAPPVPDPPAPQVVYADRPLDAAAATYRSESGAVWTVAVGPDGKTMAVGREDGSIRLIDLTDDTERALAGHTGSVWSLAFHKDGKRFVSASDDGTVKLWSVDENEPLHTWTSQTAVRAVALSPDGELMVVGDRRGKVRVLPVNDPGTDFDHAMTEYEQGGSVTAVAFAPDGNTVASAGSNKIVKLYEVGKKFERLPLVGHKGPVYSIAFSPDGKQIASAGWDGTVRVWNTNNGNVDHTLDARGHDVWSVAFNACKDRRLLATAGQDGGVRVWNVTPGSADNGTEVARWQAHTPVAHVVRFAADRHQVVSGGRDGAVRVWDVPPPTRDDAK